MLEIEGRTLLTRLVQTLRPRVPRIHLVVGYREELIIEHCALHHRDVVIVRNPDFRTTNTAQSMRLGAANVSGKLLFLDGDLIIEESSLADFIDRAAAASMLLGIARTRSEQAVCVQLDATHDGANVTAFTRSEALPFEWANVFSGPASMLDEASGYVFEKLSNYLPLPASELNLREVDTPADLAVASEFAATLDGK
jgi:choline kinase